MNLIQKIEHEEITRLARSIPEFSPGDTVVVPAQIDRESRYSIVTRAFKDWTQILSNFGLGVAAINSISKL